MFGKRSLLVQFDEQGSVAVMSASVLSQEYEVFEVPANSILFIATSDTTGFPANGTSISQNFQFAVNHSVNYEVTPSLIRWEKPIFTSAESEVDMDFENALKLVQDSLEQSVKERIETIPEILFKHDLNEDASSTGDITYNPTHSEVGILFSGGIDSTLLAALVHKVSSGMEIDEITTTGEKDTKSVSIDLLSVNFSRKLTV